MKQLLFITATILAICAILCLAGAIILDSTDTWYNPYAPYVFACGCVCAAFCALCVVARSWFYGVKLVDQEVM